MLYGVLTLAKSSPVVDTEVENQYTLNYSANIFGGKKNDLPSIPLARIYIRSYNPESGDIQIHAYKVISTELVGRTKTPRSLIENEQNDGFRPWAGDLGVDTTTGVFSELTSETGMAYLPVEGESALLDIGFRESIRNVDLQNFVQARDKDIKDIVQEISETYALKSDHEEVNAKVEEQRSTIAEILETMGANTEDLTLLKQNVKDLQDLTAVHTSDIEELKDRVSTTETDLGTAKTNLTNLSDKLNSEINTINDNFEKYDTAYNTLNDNQQQISALLNDQIVPTINEHTNKLKDLEPLTTLAGDFNDLKTDYENHKQAEALKDEVVDGLINNINSEISGIKADVSGLDENQHTLNNNFLDMKSKFENTLSGMEGYSEEFDTIKTQNAQINTRLGEVEETFESINTKINQNSDDINALKTNVEALSNKDTNLENSIALLDEKFTNKDLEITGAIETLTSQNAKDHSDILDLIDTTEDGIRKDMTDADNLLSSSLGELETEVQSQQQQVAQAIIKNNSQDATINALDSKVKDLNTDVKSVEGVLEAVNTDLDTAKGDIETLQTNTAGIRSDLDNLSTNFADHKEYVLNQLKDIKTLQDQHTSDISVLDRSITSLGEQFEGELKSATEETKYELKGLKDIVTLHTTQISDINSSLEQMQINIDDLEGSTKAVILSSEDEIENLDDDTFGLLCLGDTEELSDKDYSQILVDIAQIKTQNELLLQRVQTLEAENQDLKVKIKGE